MAITVLPAAKAATTSPVKMANGKFHGLMATIAPTALAFFRQGVFSFVGIVAAEVNGFAYFGNGVV